ncbi:unnamed protein product [Phaedon cochleariae]|uniref:AB hydrolase-1 domain-containing protein n=1 Tax=Phaedon cochleariae TaxID=80249 RepID=A0A9N9X537_PHACE|nr:unnamed protein product [Phaedon cochleariae]
MNLNKNNPKSMRKLKYSLVLDEKIVKSRCFRLTKRITFAAFKIFTVIFLVVFVVFPLIFKYSYGLQCRVVFLNFIHVAYQSDFSQPQKYGLDGTRNLYLPTEDGITLGVWQILPENLVNSSETDDQYFENILGNGQDVVIYHHGNAGTRLTGHRVELYKVLRKHFHVITFDYRSYGDSTDVRPSETDVVKDCLHIYNWVSNRTSGNIFIWAHSLGTSLAMHSLALLQSKGIQPMGVFLEAPFNNMREEISEFPLARIFRGLPWFSYTVIEPLQENGFTFRTDNFICAVDAPILILHAEDDHVVPFRLGYKLYEEGLRCRKATQGKLIFHGFDGKYGYNHKYICRDPGIHNIIRNFVELAEKESKEKFGKRLIE